jgi:hypothetical protein
MHSRLIRAALGASTTLAILTGSAAAAPAFDRPPSRPHAIVSGGGTIDAFGIPVTVEAFIVGSTKGTAQGYYRSSSSFGGAEVAVQCLRVENGRAIAAGVITQSSAPGQIGMTASLTLDDRSSSGGPPRDRIILGVAPGVPPTAICSISPSLVAGPFTVLASGDFGIDVLPF